MIRHFHTITVLFKDVAMPILLRKQASLVILCPTFEDENTLTIRLITVCFSRFDFFVLYKTVCEVVELDKLANILIRSWTDPATLFAIPLLI